MKKTLLYLFVFVAIQFAASLGMQALFRLFDPSPGLMTLQMLLSMSLFAVMTIAVFLYTRWSLVSPHYLRTRPWAVLCWSVLAALGAIIPSVWLQEQLPTLPNVMEESFSMILKGRWGYVVVGLLAPVAEEIVFRGAILRTLLQKFGPWKAIWISAVLFALVHGNPAQMPHALLVGLLLGWMYWRTGSILPGIAYHWVNNSVAYLLYNILPNPDATLVELAGGNSTKVLLWLLCSLCILVPSLLQLHQRMERK